MREKLVNYSYFYYEELSVSESFPELASKQKVTNEQYDAAVLLVESILHPLRLAFGPCAIDSWVRNTDLNNAIGGHPNSDHQYGNAVDPRFVNADHWEVFKFIYKNKMPIKQCIIYPYKKGVQLHISLNIPGRTFQNDFLVSESPGKYRRYD